MRELDLPNHHQVSDSLIACGQPSEDQLRAARDAGVRTVVNLCPPGECGWDEQAVAEGLGLIYVNIPVAGPGDVNEENANRLADALASEEVEPAIVHCGSANRVGALFALKSHYRDGNPPEEALEEGRRHGLTKLEPHVRQILGA